MWRQARARGDSPSLFLLCYKQYWTRHIAAGFLRFTAEGSKFIGPIVLHRMVSVVAHSDANLSSSSGNNVTATAALYADTAEHMTASLLQLAMLLFVTTVAQVVLSHRRPVRYVARVFLRWFS